MSNWFERLVFRQDNDEDVLSTEDVVSAKDEVEESFEARFGMAGFNDTNPFLLDVFGEEFLDVHTEMAYSKRAYYYNSLVSSSVDLLVRKLGGHEAKIGLTKGSEARSKRYDDLFSSSLLKKNRNKIFEDLIVSGNCYLQKIKVKGKTRFINIDRPERVYLDVDKDGFVKRYVYKTDNLYDAQHEVSISPGRVKAVRGVVLDKKDVVHLKIGSNTLPVYGRSLLASAVNDVKMLFEVEKSMAVNVKYKSYQRYLFNFGTANTRSKMEKIKALFRNVIGKQNILMNESEMPGVKELGFNQRDPSWEVIVKHFTRKIVAGINTGYNAEGDTARYSVADDQQEDMILFVLNMREVFTEFVKGFLYSELGRPSLGECVVTLGDLGLKDLKANREFAERAWNSNGVSLDEYRRLSGLEPEGGELGRLRRVELEDALRGSSQDV